MQFEINRGLLFAALGFLLSGTINLFELVQQNHQEFALVLSIVWIIVAFVLYGISAWRLKMTADISENTPR